MSNKYDPILGEYRQDDASGYVPYTGATANLDLGLYFYKGAEISDSSDVTVLNINSRALHDNNGSHILTWDGNGITTEYGVYGYWHGQAGANGFTGMQTDASENAEVITLFTADTSVLTFNTNSATATFSNSIEVRVPHQLRFYDPVNDDYGFIEHSDSLFAFYDYNADDADVYAKSFAALGSISAGTSLSASLQTTSPYYYATVNGLSTTPVFSRLTDLNTGMFFPAADTLAFSTGGTERLRITSTGNVGIGVTPTAAIHIKAGTATANTAPLKFTSGINLTTAEAGAVEYDGTNLFFTRAGTVRENVLVAVDNAAAPSTSAGVAITNFYGSSATNFLGTPNRWISVNILGTVYKIPMYS